MTLKIFITVLYWLFAFFGVVFCFNFINKAKLTQTRERVQIAIIFTVFVLAIGVALTGAIWVVGD